MIGLGSSGAEFPEAEKYPVRMSVLFSFGGIFGL
jgi:hypothetical protein